MTINFGEEATLAVPNVIFFVPGYLMLCLWAFPQVCLTSYQEPYPTLMQGLFTWNMIYSPGTAPRATNRKRFFFLSFFLFFLLIKTGFFVKVQGARSLVSLPQRSRRTQMYGLAIFFKELLETRGEIYLQGKRTGKTQAVCLELRSPLLHWRVSSFPSPPSPPPPPPTPESLLALIGARCCKVTQVI